MTENSILEYKKIALSEDITITTEDASSQQGIDIRDELDNEIVNITDGNIKTQNFDSTKINKNIDGTYPLAFEDEDGNVALAVTSQGHIKTQNFDSASPVITTESSDDPPFAIKDEDGNIVLQVDSTGNIQVKSFDSSQLETVIKSVVSLMGGTGIHISNNKICANISYEEISDETSPIVGVGAVGSMVIL